MLTQKVLVNAVEQCLHCYISHEEGYSTSKYWQPNNFVHDSDGMCFLVTCEKYILIGRSLPRICGFSTIYVHGGS